MLFNNVLSQFLSNEVMYEVVHKSSRTVASKQNSEYVDFIHCPHPQSSPFGIANTDPIASVVKGVHSGSLVLLMCSSISFIVSNIPFKLIFHLW